MRAKVLSVIAAFVVGIAVGLWIPHIGKNTHSASPITGELSECFEPQEDCTKFVVDAIKLAKSELLVQAYGYTREEFIDAVSYANKHGIVVRVILDKTNESERYPAGSCNVKEGIPVLVDYKVKIAHNKVFIIDRKHVVLGSLNFTKSAEKNAENVNLVKNDPRFAKRYFDNWQIAAARSRPLVVQDVDCK